MVHQRPVPLSSYREPVLLAKLSICAMGALLSNSDETRADVRRLSGDLTEPALLVAWWARRTRIHITQRASVDNHRETAVPEAHSTDRTAARGPRA